MKLRTLLFSLVLLATVGCNSAFKDAMARGDQLASVGQWDDAAAAYAEALRLDPDDKDARAALVRARHEQAGVRIALGQKRLAAGDAKGALSPLADAVRLDPGNPLAEATFGQAKAAVLAQTHKAMEEQRYKDAFGLARAYLAVDPHNGEARDLEATARAKVAEVAVVRGQTHEQSGALAAALLDYGEAVEYVPGHPGATPRLEATRKALRDQVTYWVALGNFDGDNSADELGSDVNAAVLARGIDTTLPLRIVDQLPKATSKSVKLQGMRLGGVFRGYQSKKTQTTSSRSCDYVCGTEWVANPAYATAESEMRAAQIALGQAEGRASSARSAVGPAERARDQAKSIADQKRVDAQRAEQDLSSCRTRTQSQPGACTTEEQRRDRAVEDAGLADEEARRTQQAATDAASEAQSAESDLSTKRSDAESKKQRFASTPSKVEQDKHCMHSYQVTTVVANAELECMLRGEGLYDTNPVLNQGVTGRMSQKDETFPPEAGRCAEVKNGDPLTLPSEAEVRRLTLAAAVSETQRELLASFARYRRDYATKGDAAIADKRSDAAIDHYTRFLFTFGADHPAEEVDAVVKRVAENAGVSEAAVKLAVFGGPT